MKLFALILIPALIYGCSGGHHNDGPRSPNSPDVNNPPSQTSGSLTAEDREEIQNDDSLVIEAQANGGFSESASANIEASIGIDESGSLSLAVSSSCQLSTSGSASDSDLDGLKADFTTSYSCTLTKPRSSWLASGSSRVIDLNDNDHNAGVRREVNYKYSGMQETGNGGKNYSGSIEGFTELKRDGDVIYYASRQDIKRNKNSIERRKFFDFSGTFIRDSSSVSFLGEANFSGYYLYQKNDRSLVLSVKGSNLVRDDLACGDSHFKSGVIVITDDSDKEIIISYENCNKSFSGSAVVED